jgi:Uma2 family endonuclease
MATVQLTPFQGIVLQGVDWRSYLRWLRLLEGQRSVRVTYDRGVLEVMTISPRHERYRHLLRRLIEALGDELGMAIAGFGAMTFKRKKRKRGLEPDECYWIANEPAVHGKLEIDLRKDPPPDLAFEIDVTHSSLDRLAIYAALGVPEVWRYDGNTLTFHLLGAKGKYTVGTSSQAFPRLATGDVLSFLNLGVSADESTMVRQFRTWIQQHLVAGGGTTP